MSTRLSPLAPEGAAIHATPAHDMLGGLDRSMDLLLLAALARARRPAKARRPQPPGAAVLSDRECEVLQCIASGASNKVIARALDLSPHTVKRHVANIMNKLDLHSRGQAAAWWMTRLLHPQPH